MPEEVPLPSSLADSTAEDQSFSAKTSGKERSGTYQFIQKNYENVLVRVN